MFEGNDEWKQEKKNRAKTNVLCSKKCLKKTVAQRKSAVAFQKSIAERVHLSWCLMRIENDSRWT